MKKKTYKAMLNRIYREHKKWICAEADKSVEHIGRIEAEHERDKYKKRFMTLGANVETEDIDIGGCVRTLKWELTPEVCRGYYEYWTENYEIIDIEEDIKRIKRHLAECLAKQLIENNLVQFIVKDANKNDPLGMYGVIAAKLFAVPWEQMPHKRTMELRQLVKNAMMEDK